jgi:ElaB/YqjD/DUF883 family membrane-anchored ribosome-binding protein
MEHNGRIGDVAGQAREGVRHLEQQLEERLEGVRELAESADGWIRSFARERPFVAIGCAIGLGFLLGRLAAKA